MRDLLFTAVGPQVLCKAYGRLAGRKGIALVFGTIGAVLVGTHATGQAATFRTALALAPCLVPWVPVWSRRVGTDLPRAPGGRSSG